MPCFEPGMVLQPPGELCFLACVAAGASVAAVAVAVAVQGRAIFMWDMRTVPSFPPFPTQGHSWALALS
jgi:hypothetical protein